MRSSDQVLLERSTVEIGPIGVTEIGATSKIVFASFERFVASSYDKEGRLVFRSYASPEAIRIRLETYASAYVARTRRGKVVGVLELREFRHVSMLFVSPVFIRLGLGARLVLRAALEIFGKDPEQRRLSLNSPGSATDFYRRLGFQSAATEQEENGLRFTPMVLTRKRAIEVFRSRKSFRG